MDSLVSSSRTVMEQGILWYRGGRSWWADHSEGKIVGLETRRGQELGYGLVSDSGRGGSSASTPPYRDHPLDFGPFVCLDVHLSPTLLVQPGT